MGAIILAAGQGKRMSLNGTNKVTLSLAGKPIILRIVEFMRGIGIETVVVVVGHAKESVMNILQSSDVLISEQKELRGTGDAAASALTVLPPEISDVLVVYGDDAVLYTPENNAVIHELLEKHLASDAVCSFLTIEQDNPAGLGRIIRDRDDRLLAIVEEKDATEEQKKITEINPGCFVFRVDFLKEYLPKVEKSPVTGEYYLTSLIDLALTEGRTVLTVKGGRRKWRGVNTPEELAEAEKMMGL